MLRFYSPILLLQIFCLYHAYNNKAEQRWYWFILIFPFFGCLIYLYHHFYSRENMDAISEGIQQGINQNYKLEKLEKELNFTDTVSNKTKLAAEYSSKRQYERAILLYQSCLNGLYENDPAILKKLVYNLYLNNQYKEAIQYGERIQEDKAFRQSRERLALAWSYVHNGQIEQAEQHFREMDIRFSNYEQRLDYAKFLHAHERSKEAKQLIQSLLKEIDAMDRNEKRSKKRIHRSIQAYYEQIS
ncbi:MAG: hypothetical protein AAF849_22060 [Bacteroidota bacterium]